MRRIAIKNHIEEIRLISRRCITMLIIMLLLIGLLAVRLYSLQLTNHDLYTTLSNKNSLDLVPLEPTRGLIYDRNGILLAENVPVYSLDIIPNKVSNMPNTLAEISKIIPLSDDDIASFQKQLRQHRRFDEVTLKLRLTEPEVALFSENQYRFHGAIIKARLIRHYPYKDNLSHVLGYVGRISADELGDIDLANYSGTEYIGKLGIEKSYEEELHGEVGYQQVENDASGEPLRVINQTNPIPGKNLYITIDIRLQLAAEQALGGHRGAVVAIQPSTGQVLALVSEPSYDPNLFVLGINNQEFQQLNQSIDRPLYNRALRGLYPPGSTIKPYMAIGGLEAGVVDPNYTIFDPGWYKLPNSDHAFHCWKRHGHGSVNLNRAIVVSCDTYFFNLAHRMGIQRIDQLLNSFGYGQLTGIDMDEEIPGVVASPEWKRKNKGQPWYPGDTITTGIGQSFMQVTPLQMARAVAIIAERGYRYTPHLILSLQEIGKNPQEQTVKPKSFLKLAESTWEVVIRAMQNVILSPEGTGYAHFGKIGPYSVAGKTGTAQVHSIKNYNANEEHERQDNLPERLRDNTLFVAFAPVENPQIAIAVIVENDSGAATIARKILDFYLLGTPIKPDVPKDKGNNNGH